MEEFPRYNMSLEKDLYKIKKTQEASGAHQKQSVNYLLTKQQYQ